MSIKFGGIEYVHALADDQFWTEKDLYEKVYRWTLRKTAASGGLRQKFEARVLYKDVIGWLHGEGHLVFVPGLENRSALGLIHRMDRTKPVSRLLIQYEVIRCVERMAR